MSASARSARGRQIQLPFSKAVEISVKSIRMRLWRSMITAAGIFLGIAFFTSVRTSAVFARIKDEIVNEKRAAIAAGARASADDVRLIASASSSGREEWAAKKRMQWLSIMALIVCTVGIANAMLMSVTERYKEIGTMKCLGALDMFIVKLFFIESCLLGFFASLAGFLAGWSIIGLVHLVAEGGSVYRSLFWVESGRLLFLTAAVGTALTFLATIFPAIKAAQMPPAAALRVEI